MERVGKRECIIKRSRRGSVNRMMSNTLRIQNEADVKDAGCLFHLPDFIFYDFKFFPQTIQSERVTEVNGFRINSQLIH